MENKFFSKEKLNPATTKYKLNRLTESQFPSVSKYSLNREIESAKSPSKYSVNRLVESQKSPSKYSVNRITESEPVLSKYNVNRSSQSLSSRRQSMSIQSPSKIKSNMDKELYSQWLQFNKQESIENKKFGCGCSAKKWEEPMTYYK